MCVSDTKCVPVNVDCAPAKLKVCTSVPTMDAHISSEQHKQCLKVHRLSKLSREQVKLTAPMNRLISIQQRELSKKIASFMYTVYNDAKRGTLSAWSWPSREVASLLGRTVDLSQAWTPACPSNDKLQYINPEMHILCWS